MKKLYLIDVSAMFFRAYYAIRPLSSPSGLPVNAIYGFLSMIIKLLKEEKPEYLVFCYDRKEPSFRKTMYDAYKAHRTEMPDELAQQIPYIKKLADLLGVPSFEVESFEADDIIGTAAKWGRRNDMEVFIVSGDKDFGQLVEDHIILYDTMKNVRYNPQGVFEKWGVRPDQFIDYLAIVGDTSDNVPGVKGIGEKGAIKLLEQFKHVEDIYENIDTVESKSVREKLIASRENALLSKKLVTISLDVPMPNDLDAYKLKPFHTEELKALLHELNFKSFEKSLFGTVSETAPAVPPAAAPKELVTTPAAGAIIAVAEDVTPTLVIAKEDRSFTEKSLNTRELAEVLTEKQDLWGFADARGVFVGTATEVIEVPDFDFLGRLTDTFQVQWHGYDLKNFWHKIGARTPTAAWDSQLAAYVLKAGDTSDFGKIYTRFMADVLPELASPAYLYNAHLNFAQTLQHQLQNVQGEKVYRELDLPLARVLLSMERYGVRIDKDLLAQQSADLTGEIASLEEKIHAAAGEAFNVGSPKQLGVILFEKLGLPVGKKTKTGYSTDEEVLQGLDHPIARLVLSWRELSKLKSTYVDALPTMIDPKDDRVHTSFNQALTTTGRLSSTAPNLQNIPIRTERGQQVRKAFIAAPRMKLLSVDYSQIELRILAHISEDPNLCKAFADDLDIHAATAAEVFGVPLKEVTSEHRRSAKAVNFGIAYGQGAFGLAENLGISRTEAKDIIERYFSRFKNVREYIDGTVKAAHEKGYVETLFGRRRYIDELNSKNMAMKKFGERAAINAPIQGTASDLVKKAMIEVFEQVPVRMLLQVHDELIFEDFEESLKKHTPQLVSIMENVVKLKVPLKVNYAIGDNWDEAH
ncbi:DNA polymerase I [Bdellovibrio bacteriovorus]|uniref:DNA polymerase I n=1 Tax=Bdellovibrio bacteriovorus TaxID=959 RepID=UPI0021D07C8E|nr:DNA polymerase I [Bdellovibrio bacteriovorus]UXR64700.1 DNA polymerase I [Bdellovibrio bacteriovorus]